MDGRVKPGHDGEKRGGPPTHRFLTFTVYFQRMGAPEDIYPEDIYLSVVVTSRNDNHGGKIMGRMQHCFASLSEQARRHRLPIQLLLVDWNPPADRPPLSDVSELCGSHEFFRFDVVTVPREFHDSLPIADQIPLFQYYAKNVGIRRALGRFILATNVDVIFAEALAAHLAGRKLEAGRIYRNDRWDTDIGNQLDTLGPDARQEACMRNVVQINMRQGTVPVPQLAAHTNAVPAGELPARLKQFIEALSRTLATQAPEQTKSPHMTACGDFQLLAREDWHRLRGYAELPIHSWHIDSLLELQGIASGLKEEMLPGDCPVFHIHHAPGWANQGTLEGGLDLAFGKQGDEHRLHVNGRDMPLLTMDEVDRFIAGIKLNPRATINGRDWGFAGTDFPMVTRA